MEKGLIYGAFTTASGAYLALTASLMHPIDTIMNALPGGDPGLLFMVPVSGLMGLAMPDIIGVPSIPLVLLCEILLVQLMRLMSLVTFPSFLLNSFGPGWF